MLLGSFKGFIQYHLPPESLSLCFLGDATLLETLLFKISKLQTFTVWTFLMKYIHILHSAQMLGNQLHKLLPNLINIYCSSKQQLLLTWISILKYSGLLSDPYPTNAFTSTFYFPSLTSTLKKIHIHIFFHIP
jgi:hypothetical protein